MRHGAIESEIMTSEAAMRHDPQIGQDTAPEGLPSSVEVFRPLPRISIHAFCETERFLTTMAACAQDRRMAKTSLKISHGSIQDASDFFASASTPSLLIIETLSASAQLLADLQALAEVCDPTTKVVVVGHHNDVTLYRELIRNGISEYVVAPMSMADMIGTVAALFNDPDAAPLGRLIAFVGVKGGVGASTLAHNCAWSVANLFSDEVILADLDLAFGTANINFDQDPPQGISEAVYAPERLDEVFLDRLLSKCSDRLSLLAAPSMLDRTYDFNSESFRPILELAQRSTPVTILDVPHMWCDWTQAVLADVDEIVLVAAPDLANLRNTKNFMDCLKKLRPNDHAPHLIINQVGMPKRPEIAVDDFCDPLEMEPIATIPYDGHLFGTAANGGLMLGETDAKSPITASISQIAHVVTGRMEVKTSRRRGLGGLLLRLAGK